jgi:tRNA(fMet)-specific endonuclease VapC
VTAVSYLLDTGAVAALLSDRPAGVRERYREAEAAGDYLAVSSIALAEVWYAVAASSHLPLFSERLTRLLAGGLERLEFDAEDARAVGRVRAALDQAGIPVTAHEAMIAGQALRRGLTVVTASLASFTPVEGLTWEDWAAASAGWR